MKLVEKKIISDDFLFYRKAQKITENFRSK